MCRNNLIRFRYKNKLKILLLLDISSKTTENIRQTFHVLSLALSFNNYSLLQPIAKWNVCTSCLCKNRSTPLWKITSFSTASAQLSKLRRSFVKASGIGTCVFSCRNAAFTQSWRKAGFNAALRKSCRKAGFYAAFTQVPIPLAFTKL